MNDTSLRHALRAHTKLLHDRLDATVGGLEDVASYVRYLQRTHVFRQAIERNGIVVDDWQVERLEPALARDLQDLGLGPAEDAGGHGLSLVAPAQHLAAAYVLEGSALGAHLLFGRAKAMGFGADNGARHLAQQTADRRRWPDFVAFLDRCGTVNHDAVLAAASTVFAFALSIYAEKADGNA